MPCLTNPCVKPQRHMTSDETKMLTVAIAQTTKVVRDAVQVIPVWRDLYARVVGCARRRRFIHTLAHVWGQWRRHVVGEIKVLEREIYDRLDLVRERSLDGEALEVDQQDRG